MKEDGKNQLQILHLKKDYPKKQVLKDVTLNINGGEIVGLLGENGAGKTTLMNCISGNIPYHQGEILYGNQNLRHHSEVLCKFGFLVRINFLDYLTAEENLYVLGSYLGIDRRELKQEISSALKYVKLYDKREEYTTGFSFGQMQRLGVAQAILGEKRFLILDEPFVGLDSQGKEMLEKLLVQKAKEEKVGILLSSHDMDEVEKVCTRLAIMHDGRIAYDAPYEGGSAQKLYDKTVRGESVEENDQM